MTTSLGGTGSARRARHLLAVYDEEQSLVEAVAALQRSGYQLDDIGIVAREENVERNLRAQTGAQGTMGAGSRGLESRLADTLIGMGLPDVEARHVEALLQDGQIVLNVFARTPERDVRYAASVLPGKPTKTLGF